MAQIIGETGVGEMGVGETGTNLLDTANKNDLSLGHIW